MFRDFVAQHDAKRKTQARRSARFYYHILAYAIESSGLREQQTPRINEAWLRERGEDGVPALQRAERSFTIQAACR